jgi:hypothetical protein
MIVLMCVSIHLASFLFRTPSHLHFSHVVFASAGLAKVLLLHAGVGCMACVPGLHVVVLLVGWLLCMACWLFS